MRCCFGCVLGGSGGGFLRHFGPDLVDFEGSESNFELEVGSRKSDFRHARGTRPRVQAAQLLIVDQSIIDNIHRRSLKIS